MKRWLHNLLEWDLLSKGAKKLFTTTHIMLKLQWSGLCSTWETLICCAAFFHSNNSKDFSSPFVVSGKEKEGGHEPSFPPESVSMITSMGFSSEQATFALKQTNGSVERAADWIFSHMSELDTLMAEASSNAEMNESLPKASGSGRYRLRAIISHLGQSAQTGHYVCHIKQGDEWVIFNDRKVAISQHPPTSFAYIYLFQAIE
eukprot:m.67024 g.67024  ORF g.67024 m.67024 type:complete len:203 (-) comp8202_c3_seq2:120-728(-)